MDHYTYKFRAYPTKEQEETLLQWIGCGRKIWNLMLDLNQKQYKENNKFVFYNQMASEIIAFKADPQYSYLKEVPSQALQQKCKQLDVALKRSFKKDGKKASGFPKFKSRHTDTSGVLLPQGFHIKGNRINLPKMKNLKIKKHQNIEGKIKSCTIKKNKCGHWYVCLLVEQNIEKRIIDENRYVGIDVGIKEFLVTSDSEVVENPKYLKKSEHKLKKKQRQLSKKQKGSKNRDKARHRLAKQHLKISNQRNNFINQTVHSITKNYDIIGIESLNITGMQQNHKLAKAISDASWGLFFMKLEAKTNRLGTHLVKIDRFAPSTKTCSHCKKEQNMSLDKRMYVCHACGYEIDRDLNAAINIRNWSMDIHRAGTAQIYACGDALIETDSSDSTRIIETGINS